MRLECRASLQFKRIKQRCANTQAGSLQVHGIDVDFVNLRTETYADGSRIPEAKTGTPQQARFVSSA